MRTSMIAVACAAALLGACGGDGGGYGGTNPMPTSGPVVTSATVAATPAIQFTPATVNLAVGGTVEFDFGTVAQPVLRQRSVGRPGEHHDAEFQYARRHNVPGEGALRVQLPHSPGNDRGHRRSVTPRLFPRSLVALFAKSGENALPQRAGLAGLVDHPRDGSQKRPLEREMIGAVVAMVEVLANPRAHRLVQLSVEILPQEGDDLMAGHERVEIRRH
jgi:hypothetical protein